MAIGASSHPLLSTSPQIQGLLAKLQGFLAGSQGLRANSRFNSPSLFASHGQAHYL
jgi:hypothetical protein